MQKIRNNSTKIKAWPYNERDFLTSRHKITPDEVDMLLKSVNHFCLGDRHHVFFSSFELSYENTKI